MPAPYIVPRGLSEWTQQLPFRVEHQVDGTRCSVYFDDSAAAQSFAARHMCFNKPCIVECKTMPVTHRVEVYSTIIENFVLSRQTFGDPLSARSYFDERALALKQNTAARLIHQETGRKLAVWFEGLSDVR